MNKIQKIGAVLAAVALTAVATQVSAMTEAWQAAVSRFLTLQGGTTGVPSGGLLRLGILNSATAADMTGNQDSLLFINAHFSTWGTGLVGDGGFGDGTFVETTIAPGAGFFSTQLYVLAENPGATQVGLFTNSSWISPASDPSGGNSLEFADAGLVAVIGALTTGTVTSPSDIALGDAASLHLIAVIPEPSSLMLIGLGLVGLVGLLRRRS